jgi:dihydroorotase-like cyclic amidohydrolase
VNAGENGRVDLLITGGTVVDAGVAKVTDLAVANGLITAVGDLSGRLNSARTVDASGLLVLPGLVDGHFHCAGGSASPVADDMRQGPMSAVHGGVTTVMAHVFGNRGQPLTEALESFAATAGSRSLIDYGMHCGVRPEPNLVDQIPTVVTLGSRSFKFHLAYRKTGDGRMFDTDLLLAGMEQVASIGGVAIVHAEDGHVIDHLENKLSALGQTAASSFLGSRPSIAEEMAIERVSALSELSGCPVVFAHVTSARSASRLADLQATRPGLHAETQPHYLVLTDDDLKTQGAMLKVGETGG